MTEDQEDTRDSEEFVTVWSTTDPALLPVLKSAMESSGIPFVVIGEEALGLFPLGGLRSSLTQGVRAQIQVPPDRADEAREFIETGFLPGEVAEPVDDEA